MIAGVYNLTIEQGAYFTRVLTWKDSTGALVNLTGYTAKMKAKSQDGTTTYISLTTTPNANGDVITLGGVAGTITLAISAASTTALNFSESVYDIELVDGAGKTYRLIKGVIDLSLGVTL